MIDHAIGLRFLGGEDEVAIGVIADLLHRLAAVLGQDLIGTPTHADDLASVDLEVCRLPFHAAVRLVQQDA